MNFLAKTSGAVSALDAISSLVADQGFLEGKTAAGVCVLLIGPRGTGKTSVALTLPGRIGRNRVFSISDFDMHRLDNGPDPDAIASILKGVENTLDAVVLLDDLDHLAALSEGKALAAIGTGLLALARRHPHRLLIVGTGTDRVVPLLDPGRRWLGQLDVRTIQFPAFDREVIKAVAIKLLTKEGLRVSLGAQSMLGSQADDMLEERASFDNGHAVRRLVSRILANRRMRLKRDPTNGVPEIIKDDVRDASWGIT